MAPSNPVNELQAGAVGQPAPSPPLPPALAERIIDYGPFIHQTTRGFVGRQWLRARLDGFLQAGDKRCFLLSGEPGLGKTAFLAHLVAERGYVHHFVSARDLDWLSPAAFAESMGAQLARRFGAWVLAEDEPPPGTVVDQRIGTLNAGGTAIGVLIAQYVSLPVEELARKLILRPLRRLASQTAMPVVLLVDAVDEAVHYSGQTTIIDLLVGLGMTANVRLLLTAHPGPTLEALRDDLLDAGLLDLLLQGEDAQNLADVRAYLAQAAGEPDVSQALTAAGLSPTPFVEQALSRSEGNFLYARSLLDAIRSGQAGLDLSALPAGLAGYYRDQMRRFKDAAGPEWRRIYRPVLGMLSVARSPLQVSQLAEWADVERDAVVEVIDRTRPLVEARAEVGGRPTYAWYHRAAAEFLLSERDNPDDWFEPRRYHAQIADRIATLTPDPAQIADNYALRNLSYHTRQAGTGYFPRLYALITPAVRQARRARFGSDALFSQDLAEAIEAALAEGPVRGLPQLVRCGLIDAMLSSMVTEVPSELLRELAWLGQWPRALSLAQLGAGLRGQALHAIVEGVLLGEEPDRLDVARQVAATIPAEGDDAGDRARALSRIAQQRIATGEADTADGDFGAAAASAALVPTLDARARALAAVACMRFATEPDAAQADFVAAIAALDEMQAAPDAATWESVGASNMMVQSAPEAGWSLRHATFDTVGARARAMADVAAAMARAGAAGAQELFDRADEIAAGIPAAGMGELFGAHARDYIAAQRALPAETIAAPEATTLENRLAIHSHPPADGRGFYAQAFLALAEALARRGAVDQSVSLIRQARESAAAADGGYRAQLLARMAGLLAEMDRAQRAAEPSSPASLDLLAQQLAGEARQIAGEDADLLTSYRALLAQMGTTWAAELREIAGARAMMQKRRYFSDKAVAEMALALVERDLMGAWELARSIQDASQRMRAVAAVAGHLTQSEPAQLQVLREQGIPPGEGAAAGLVRHELASLRERGMGEWDYPLAAAIEVLAPLAPAAAGELSADLTSSAFVVKALVDVAGGTEAQGLPAQPAWEKAWVAAQAVGQTGATLALAIGRIARHGFAAGDARAAEMLARALDAVRGEQSRLERIDATVEIASTLVPNRPAQAQALLDEALRVAGDLEGGGTQGPALSRIVGVQAKLDPGRACRLLADLRRLGRDSFLDGVTRIVPAAADLGGTALIEQMAQSLEDAQGFFSA